MRGKRTTTAALPAMMLFAMALTLPGCGSSSFSFAPVSGTVTYRGKPVGRATVVFHPERGPAAFGVTDAEGRYALTSIKTGDGAVVGKHVVTIEPATPGMSLTPGEAPRSPKPPTQTPPKYATVATSGLNVEVASGNNTHNFELKD